MYSTMDYIHDGYEWHVEHRNLDLDPGSSIEADALCSAVTTADLDGDGDVMVSDDLCRRAAQLIGRGISPADIRLAMSRRQVYVVFDDEDH